MTTEIDVYARAAPQAERRRAEDAALEHKLRSESLTRLVANPDFRQWLSFAHVVFEGAAYGQRELTPFEQGRRAAFSFLLDSLADARGFPELAGEMSARHYKAVQAVRENAHRTDKQGDRQ